ncbi:hypothetical protein GCM10010156_70730 [Planobispora rosea]|uniref:Uncharacterized protein n=1 Tax=Planobispora rosea TaxID=35762 RepID=A0A8J3WI51_PLARO|nr:DUF5708 family protein [Planobispora rosea]GGT02560.1 hypothetical protein GCM10010156_70730 [Planobispora rosea]GIH88516.1 hypothetical protein Pro02_69240 [Planobispora rosea]
MASARKTLFTGSITFVAGLALWLFGLDEEIFIFTPSKIGVILMVVGGLEFMYGIYKSVRGDDEAY